MAISYQREALLDEITCDLLNGMSRFQVQRKLQEKQYDSQVKDKEPSPKSISAIIKESYDRCKLELKEERDEQRALMYSRVLAVYEDAIANSDRSNALKALSQLTDLMGLNEPDKVEVKGQITNNLRVKVNFGISDDKDDEGTGDEDDEE